MPTSDWPAALSVANQGLGAAPDPSSGPPPGHPLPDRPARLIRRLGPHHFAYLRSIAEGLDANDSAHRYLGITHGHERRSLHAQLVGAVQAIARRSGERAWRLVVWQYADEMVNMFYTAFMGNAQRLPNGNTHITESATGRLFEVTPAGEVIWEYIIPWFAEYSDAAARQTGPGRLNSVFQTFRYSREQLPWLSV